MKTNIIQIGNSRGVRIPKILLKQCCLEGEVDLQARKGQLIIRPLEKPRRGWEEAFRRMAASQDDRLIDRDQLTSSDWDKKEWEW